MIKHTISLGLVGMVMAVTAAEAAPASCPETKAVLIAVDYKWVGYEDYPITNPTLIGREFRVLKRTAGPVMRTEHLLLQSSKQTYVIRSEWTPRTTGTLYTSTTARAKPRPAIAPGKVAVGDFPTTTIWDGPLKGLSLKVGRCL